MCSTVTNPSRAFLFGFQVVGKFMGEHLWSWRDVASGLCCNKTSCSPTYCTILTLFNDKYKRTQKGNLEQQIMMIFTKLMPLFVTLLVVSQNISS